MLTGVNAVLGVGEASGMFPIDSRTSDYDAAMLGQALTSAIAAGQPWKLRDILPQRAAPPEIPRAR